MACGAHVLAYAIGRPAGAQPSGRARQPTRLRSITRCQFGDGRANLPKQPRAQLIGLPRDALAVCSSPQSPYPSSLPQRGWPVCRRRPGYSHSPPVRLASRCSGPTAFCAGAAAIGSPDYATLAALLSVMVGIVLIGAALLRAGWVADLLSIPVTAGFMAGIAVHIIVGQLPSVLGVPDTQGTLTARFVHVLHRLPDANAYALGIGLFVLVATQATERVAKRLPGALLALTTVAVATAALHLELHGVDVLGALPATLPRVALPTTKLGNVLQISPLALIVALVCMMQTAAVSGPTRRIPRARGIWRATSAASGRVVYLAGLIGGFAVNASPPRTAVVVSAGGGSQAVSLVAVILATALLFGGGGLLAFVPQAALGGILIAVALRIFRLNEIVNIARHGGSEIWLVAASILLVVGLPIETGMLASIVLSLLHSFYTVVRPLCWSLPVRPAPPSGGRPKARLGITSPASSCSLPPRR